MTKENKNKIGQKSPAEIVMENRRETYNLLFWAHKVLGKPRKNREIRASIRAFLDRRNRACGLFLGLPDKIQSKYSSKSALVSLLLDSRRLQKLHSWHKIKQDKIRERRLRIAKAALERNKLSQEIMRRMIENSAPALAAGFDKDLKEKLRPPNGKKRS